MTQIWYSLRLSEEDFTLVMGTLQELIHASSLEELTRGTMKLEQDHLHTLVQVWRTWLHLLEKATGLQKSDEGCLRRIAVQRMEWNCT